ncbi:hypothetical protein [Wolbachia endosymbiont of Ctenocephalides felis wCfeJ]|uniref:hypothetical protein n=1 Tax=Wolbachia endosymbiont of Ctenocephalides felis wCfeJ TaxID=2732594 RepID=UPI001446E24D|nr:hypothetical protein [Wolbachia endosymbiont of Ctenocephalides felis wCfeJ]WCR58105.1 MAG: hypothetical protein PG980_000577 [Wolbachia endosymbiont of Ctenocephalides felis wCfeJ]
MLGTAEKSTYFTKLKAGGRFAIYAFGIYLTATFTISCLGLIIGSSLLTLPLAMLISHPIMWIVIGVALAVTYKVAIEPLFYWIKGYVSGKEADQDKDSGVGSEGPEDVSRRSSNASFASSDSGLGGKEFHENLDTLVHQTNRENYAYWLQQHDIAHIAKVKYRYSENSTNGVFFCIPGNLDSLNERLKEYKDKAERENTKSIFTSVINLGGNHWVTLVVAYNSEQFRAYYCDSFSADLPSPGSQRKKIELANEIKDKLIPPLTKQAGELNAQGKKEMGEDVQKTAQTCRDKKNELVNVPIDTDNMVSALEAILGIGDDSRRSSKTKQQNDGCNCGIFALENASKITQMLSECKSFDDIDKELSEYKFDLNEKRKEFAEALMNDEKWKKDLENGLLCDLSPRTATSPPSTSRGQAPSL